MSSSKLESSIYISVANSIGIKIVSFMISILTARFSSMSDFGKLSVQYQLFVSIALFLLKEGFRKSAIRQDDGQVAKSTAFWGVLVSIFVVCVSGFVGVIYFHIPHVPVILTCTGLLIEAIAEIFLIHHIVIFDSISIRTNAETWATFSRSISLLGALIWTRSADMAFGISQIIYGLVWFLILGYPVLGSEQPVVGRLRDFPVSALGDLAEMSLLAVQKLFLTEGERILAVSFLTSEEMGRLGLVTNLGSIVLRIIFAPIEDIAFTGLARSTKLIDRLQIVQSVFGIEISIGVLGAVFGPLVSSHAIRILYGPEWAGNTEVVTSLSAYCALLLLYGANGALEAFNSATANSSKVRASMVFQALAFFTFVAVSIVCHSWLQLGTISIIIGNGISMIVRILFVAFSAFPHPRDFIHVRLGQVILRIVIVGLVCGFVLHLIPDRSMLVDISISCASGLLALGLILKPLREMLAKSKSS